MKVIKAKNSNYPINAKAKVGIVVSRFNDFITERLLAGALQELERMGVDEAHITVVWVPGAFEIPLAAQALVEKEHAAIIALGCVIRGATAHFDHVAGECNHGLTRIALDYKLPVGNAVLTVDTIEQAIERAGSKAGNKGGEAAHTILDMLSVMGQL